MSRRPSVHVAACGPIDRKTANAIGTMAGLVMRDAGARGVLRAVVEAHQLYVAHLVGVQVGVIKPGPVERRERLRYWMRLCDAVRTGDQLLNPKATASAPPRLDESKRPKLRRGSR